MTTIRVPDVPGPVGVCWKQDTRLDGSTRTPMARCTFTTGHAGPHQWEAQG